MELFDLASRVGNLAWVQAKSFEVVGQWASVEPDPQVRLQFFSHSRRQGFHAKALVGLLPRLAGHSLDEFVVPKISQQEGFFKHISGATSTRNRLVFLYEYSVPVTMSLLKDFLDKSDTISEMPHIRVISQVFLDEAQDLRLGQKLLVSSQSGSE